MKIKLNKYYWCKADMIAWKVINISDNKVALVNKHGNKIEVSKEEFKENYYIKPCQSWI